jgi:hypothetical protein
VNGIQSEKIWTVGETTSPRRPRTPRPKATSSPNPRSQSRSPFRTRHASDQRDRSIRNDRLSVWARLIFVAMLGVAILWWPYGRSCGLGLALYTASTAMIVVGGLWVVACTWICRMARTHGLAMLVVLWGLGLIGVEVLPRIGYATADASRPPVLRCPAR